MRNLFPNAWHVARREFRARAGSRSFVVTTLILALLAVGMALLPTIVRLLDTDEPTRIGLHTGEGVDEQMVSATLHAVLADSADAPTGPTDFTVVPVEEPEAAWQAQAGELHGILEVNRGADGELAFAYRTDSGPMSLTLALVQQAATSLAVDDRLARADVPPDERAALFEPAAFQIVGSDPAVGGPDEFFGNYLIATALLLIGLLALILYGNWVATSVAEEKSSRVMELLITSATPSQLLAGKVLGTGAAGLTQYAAIVIPAALVLLLSGPIESALLGLEPATTPVGGLTLEVLLGYGLFLGAGFLLYITLYAAAGSMVSRQEDVAHVSGPTGFLLMGAYFGTFIAMQSLNAAWVSVMSMIPFFSPFLMPTRMLLDTVPLAEVILALAILLASVVLALAFAARIYSAGVLLYGQRRGFREVLRATRMSR